MILNWFKLCWLIVIPLFLFLHERVWLPYSIFRMHHETNQNEQNDINFIKSMTKQY